MQAPLRIKLQQLLERYDELGALLSDCDTIARQRLFQAYAKEYAEIEPIVLCFQSLETTAQELEETNGMLDDSDCEIRIMAEEEVKNLTAALARLGSDLQTLLLPKDAKDARNVFLEIRAGTGGDEAAIFVGDLLRMYSRYAETKKWKIEIINQREGEHGGFKEIIARIEGKDVYGQLKFESGAHRVQRVPQTESQGRIHTSACTVAVMSEVEQIDEIEINKGDLRIDTYRASGAGGQHVNKTDSAVRLTHLPTNIVVECQDERSQHKNKARAMGLLQAKIMDDALHKRDSDQAKLRRNLVGSGDRSEKIRTYNYPDSRITDHRIDLTLYRLTQTLAGDLDPIVNQLALEHQADLLSRLSVGGS